MRGIVKAISGLALVALGVFGVSAPAQAANLLVNSSFESPDLGTGNYTYPAATLDDWDYAGSALVNASGYSAWYGNSAPSGQDGAQFAALQGGSSLSQTFTSGLAPASLTWIAAGRPNLGGYGGDQTYNVLIDGSVVAPNEVTTSGAAFASHSISLAGLASGTHTVTFQGLAVTDQTAFIDNVVVTAVPETVTWAMMILGFGLVGMTLRSPNRVIYGRIKRA